MRVEARRVRHRDPGAEHGALEGAAEVAVAGEPQPPALGVAHPEALDGRGLLRGVLAWHGGHRLAARGARAAKRGAGGGGCRGQGRRASRIWREA